ncbi:MAG: PAS domain-containing protein, partial [Gluconacetobacter diazotrophicus]|nr:PAS domain-containing protein [Gluconacetobacter diazotrophicus]
AALRSVESQVAARTEELSRRNGQLRAEIASREWAELALRESELQFRELAENIQEVFWMYNADATELLYLSPAFDTVWGRPRSDHGITTQTWVETLHPEDRERVRSSFAASLAIGTFEAEYRILRPDGTVRWVHDRAFPIRDATGSVYRIAGIATDITERKRREAVAVLRARQQQTVAELGEFALKSGEIGELLAEACRVVRGTLGVDFCGVCEHQPERGMFVARAADGLPAGGRTDFEFPDGKSSGSGYAVLAGEPVIIEDAATETRFQVSRWGQKHGARWGIIVLIGGDGSGLPSYGTFTVFCRERRTFTADDVFFLQGVANVLAAAISRRRKDEALRIAKEEAELANSAKSSFLSRMSHELRTPLNAILGFSQLLQMDAPTTRQAECIRHVLTSGQQLLTMIDDVLDISRLELGHGTLTPEPVALRDAIRLSMDLLRPMAAPRGVSLELADDPAADRAVLVNRQRLNQVLLNLLTNAVKYNRPGGRVVVSCRVMPAARLRITVADTGPGIAPENVARLFVPFDRLGAERTDTPGTGLGLALCKNLVEVQGGQIGVESTVGEGSRFWVQFPLAPPAAGPAVVAVPEGGRTPLPPARRVPRRRTRTVLYVEDNLSNLRLIERLLQRHPGVRLLSATTGGEGLELARRRRPDLVLLDSHLPDRPGREVLLALRADPATRAIPVVVVSADALPASIAALRAAGACDYLTKPLDVHRITELLADLA